MKIENAIKRFEKSGIFPWTPIAVKMGKLAPASIYQKPDPMPVIDNSFVEPAEGDVPVVKSAKPQPSTSAEGQIQEIILTKQMKPKSKSRSLEMNHCN